MNLKLHVKDLATTLHPYPSYSFSLHKAWVDAASMNLMVSSSPKPKLILPSQGVGRCRIYESHCLIDQSLEHRTMKLSCDSHRIAPMRHLSNLNPQTLNEVENEPKAKHAMMRNLTLP